jgi:hypothetical protein
VSAQAQSLLLLGAGLLFVLFLIAKLVVPARTRGTDAREARRRIAEARRRASDRALGSSERAAALREAAVIALQELRRPNLAASYARRAERLDPRAPDALALLSAALRSAARFRALERLLWRRVAEATPADSSSERALEELMALYDGPLKRPEVARALRRLRAASAATEIKGAG